VQIDLFMSTYDPTNPLSESHRLLTLLHGELILQSEFRAADIVNSMLVAFTKQEALAALDRAAANNYQMTARELFALRLYILASSIPSS